MRTRISALGTLALLWLSLSPPGVRAQTTSAEASGAEAVSPGTGAAPSLLLTLPDFFSRSARILPIHPRPATLRVSEKHGSRRLEAAPQAPKESNWRPRGEVYVGLAYNNLSLLGFEDRRHSVGWGTNVTAHFTRYFGVTADFGGQYNPECGQNDVKCIVELLQAAQIEDYNSHQFLAGPRITFPGERFQGFVHALFGGVRTHVSLLDTMTGQRTKITSGPNFAMAFGGGLDWNVGGPRFAVRLFQFDIIPVREGSSWRRNVRIQGGLVVRF